MPGCGDKSKIQRGGRTQSYVMWDVVESTLIRRRKW